MPPAEEFSLDRLSELARIDIPEADRQKVQVELSQMLEFVNVLEELDLEDVQPFFGMNADNDHRPVRDDQQQDSFAREDILKNAPDSDGECYRVPPVFE